MNPKLIIDDGDGNKFESPLLPKDFSTGSTGYFLSGRVALKNKEGELVMHTITCNIVEVGSKEKKSK
jgi:hypothetical protein